MSDISFFEELQKRRVIKVAAIYGAVAWGAIEIIVTVAEQLFLPPWISRLAVISFVVGFPIAMFLAWTFDITPEGIQRTEIGSRRGLVSILGAVSLLLLGTAGLFLLIRPATQELIRADSSPVALPKSIVILPFENMSRNPDDNYLSEGFSDQLRDQLGRVSGLRIAARSSSNSVRQRSSGAKEISASLGVALLVEGSIRRRGDKLYISVQLIEGSSGLAIWSASYDRSPTELLSVQRIVAEEIVRQILPGSSVAITQPSTESSSANELLLLARYYEQQVRERPEVDFELLMKAITLYRQATEVDPKSALAHSKLASALLYAGDISAAEAPIFIALSINPELSQVQNTLGEFFMQRSLPGASVAYRRAVELNPNNADALADYAHWLWMQGDNKAPAALYVRALELDPLSLSRFGALGLFYGYDGNVTETLKIVSRIENMFDSATAYRLIARLLELTGRIDQGIAWTIRARNLEPQNPANVGMLAELYAEIGDFDTALQLEPEPGLGLLFKMRNYDQLIDEGEFRMIEEPEDIALRYLLAFSYNATGQFDKAVWMLKSAGLPDSVVPNTKQAADYEALVYLIDALDGLGEREVARDLAGWTVYERRHVSNQSWWANLYAGCVYAVLGEDDEVRKRFDTVATSKRLPWNNLIRDSHCWQRFAKDAHYQSMLQSIDERRASLRSQLPRTLADFGVSL
jgi:TolB-like protein/thioredoxin-like negative regulator of GroEL